MPVLDVSVFYPGCNLKVRHNSDFSGLLTIFKYDVNGDPAEQFNIPAKVIKAVAAEMIRARRIAAIEQLESDELLFGCSGYPGRKDDNV